MSLVWRDLGLNPGLLDYWWTNYSLGQWKILLTKLDVSKSMGPDEIHPKILKYLSSNESFINVICKLFEKFIEYKMVQFIWKTTIVIPQHKNVLIHLKSNYQPISITRCGHESETNGSSRQKRVRLCQGSNLIRRKKQRHYCESVCMWKKRKILTAVSIIHLQPILKEKREGAPEWIFIGWGNGLWVEWRE